ncbi:MAG: 50S ribosome-binding GTPase [Anaerolineae bacterium]|nr:50S ribosome-binding GTPase [Anaerolineae bacterium]
MPTNLPPEYFDIEERYRAAQSTEEKIACIEEMLSVIPKHKGTDKLRADLRRRLSKFKSTSEARKDAGKQTSPYHVEREGAGQIAVVGPANVGKSSLVGALTNAKPEVADYPYTTSRPIPGMMPFENVQIQLIDTPPLSKEYEEPQLMDLIRRVDLILLLVDLQAYPIQQIEDSVALLEEHRIVPIDRRDHYPEHRRLVFKPLLVLVNKTDDERLDADFEALCELLGKTTCPLLPISAVTGRNFDRLKPAVFERLGVMRIYSKPPGKEADLSAPFVLKQGGTVEEFAAKVHRDFVDRLKSARIWGSGVYDAQMVGRDHILHDGDVVELRI